MTFPWAFDINEEIFSWNFTEQILSQIDLKLSVCLCASVNACIHACVHIYVCAHVCMCVSGVCASEYAKEIERERMGMYCMSSIRQGIQLLITNRYSLTTVYI